MGRRPQVHLKQAVEEFGTGTGSARIVGIVEAGLHAQKEAEQQERLQRDDKGIKQNPYVSDAGKCVRKVYLSLTGEAEAEPLTTDSLINFGVGHAVEDWIGGIFESNGGTVMRELRVEIPAGDTVVTGRVDFLVALPSLDSLVELKTTSSRSMYWMLKKGEPGKDDHRRQLNQYLHASQLGLLPVVGGGATQGRVAGESPAPAPRFTTGYLIYVVKDATRGEPPIHAFEVRYNEEMAKADLASAAHIKKLADNDMDPGVPVGYTKSKWPCGYCSYVNHCWPARSKRVAS